jgi:hypothetical protein
MDVVRRVWYAVTGVGVGVGVGGPSLLYFNHGCVDDSGSDTLIQERTWGVACIRCPSPLVALHRGLYLFTNKLTGALPNSLSALTGLT